MLRYCLLSAISGMFRRCRLLLLVAALAGPAAFLVQDTAPAEAMRTDVGAHEATAPSRVNTQSVPSLTGLSLSAEGKTLALSPAFNSNVRSYAVEVPYRDRYVDAMGQADTGDIFAYRAPRGDTYINVTANWSTPAAPLPPGCTQWDAPNGAGSCTPGGPKPRLLANPTPAQQQLYDNAKASWDAAQKKYCEIQVTGPHKGQPINCHWKNQTITTAVANCAPVGRDINIHHYAGNRGSERLHPGRQSAVQCKDHEILVVKLHFEHWFLMYGSQAIAGRVQPTPGRVIEWISTAENVYVVETTPRPIAPPSVTLTGASTSVLDVVLMPDDVDRDHITFYSIRYAPAGTEDWETLGAEGPLADGNCLATGQPPASGEWCPGGHAGGNRLRHQISRLDPNTEYRVQVRAYIHLDHSEWAEGTGSTLSASPIQLDAPGYQAAVAAGSLLEMCASHLPANAVSVAEVTGWRDAHPNHAAHVLRWNRVLEALGEDTGTGVAGLTVDESRANELRYMPARWSRVTGTLEGIGSCISAILMPGMPVNRPPVVVAPLSDVTISNESGARTVSLSGVFADADYDDLAITAASSDEAAALVSVAHGYLSLTVTAQARGTATITVTADDGNGGTVADTFTVRVKAAPTVAQAIADLSGLEVDATRDISLSGVFHDADGDALTITAASSAASIATAIVTADQAKLTVSGVAAGSATIVVTAEDSDGNRVSDSFRVEVVKATEPEEEETSDGAPIVVAPVADFGLEGPEIREIDLSLVFRDPDGDELTFRVVSSNYGVAAGAYLSDDRSKLSVVGMGTGTATITITAEDSDGNTVSDRFDVTVTPYVE